MAKARKRKPISNRGKKGFIYIRFKRAPENTLALSHALDMLVGKAGVVDCGMRVGIDGEFSSDGTGWCYHVRIYDIETLESWAGRLAVRFLAILKKKNVSEPFWTEMVVVAKDGSKQVLPRTDPQTSRDEVDPKSRKATSKADARRK